MFVDLSLLKNIDFTNRDNILFLVITFVIATIVIIICFIVFMKIIKIFKKIIVKFFKKYIGNPEKNKSETQNRTQQRAGLDDIRPKQKNMAMGDINNFPSGKENNNNNNNNVSAQKAGVGINFKINGEKKNGKSDAQESYKEKENKSIAEHLGKLKADQGEVKNTLASKMPSRVEVVKEEANFDKIQIPKRKDFSADKDVRGDGLVGGSGKRDVFGEVPNNKPRASAKDGIKNISKASGSTSIIPGSKKSDSSIFDGQSEVSRIKLAYKVRRDPKVWQAGRAVGLQLSPVERSNLVKEVFSPRLGTNISKKDLQTSLRQLNRKMLNTTKDPKTHEKLRKEIKFFKKIGGIK